MTVYGLTRKEFLTLADVPLATWESLQHRGESAMAFGTKRELAGGKYLALDVVAHLLVDELMPAFTRPYAADIVRGFSDVWTHAVSEAQRNPSVPYFLVVLEVGEKRGGRKRAYREGVNVGCGTLRELGEKLIDEVTTVPERLTAININSIIKTIQERGLKNGLDLSEPFCPPPDDPDFERVKRETREWREKNIARLGEART